MEKIFLNSAQIKKIIRKKRELEKELNIKLISGKDFIDLEGESLNEYTAAQLIKAMSMGFSIEISLLLKDEGYTLQTINIKNYIKNQKQRLNQVKARIIGKKGRVLKNISQLSDCAIKLQDNSLAVLGKIRDVEIAVAALISLIQGSKHSSIFARLERAQHEEKEELNLELK
jgi:ribosomal RNA assembly protein